MGYIGKGGGRKEGREKEEEGKRVGEGGKKEEKEEEKRKEEEEERDGEEEEEGERHVYEDKVKTFQKKPRKAESPSPVALTSRSQSAPRRTLTKGGLAIVSRTENQHRPSPRNAVDLPAFMCAWPCVRFPAFPWVCNCPFACLSVCVWDSVAIWD